MLADISRYFLLSQLRISNRTALPRLMLDAIKDFGLALEGSKTGLKDIMIVNYLFSILGDYGELFSLLAIVFVCLPLCVSLMF